MSDSASKESKVSDQMADKVDSVSSVTDEMVRAVHQTLWPEPEVRRPPALDRPLVLALAAVEAVYPLILAKRDAEIRARIEAEKCVGGTLSAEDVAFNDGLDRAIALLTEGVDGE